MHVLRRNLGASQPHNRFKKVKKKKKRKSIIPKFSLWSWEQGCKAMTSRHVPHSRLWTDGFLISDFWFLISDFRFPFSVFHFPFSYFWFPISHFPCLISDFWFLISDFWFLISDLGFLISDFGFPKSRFLISVFGNQKIPAINFWVLIHEIQKTDWPQSFLIYYAQAEKRLNSLKKRVMSDDKYCTDYCSFMSDIISKGYARKVDDDLKDQLGRTWYLPHHGIYHPQKPTKIRVVFDCSASFEGHSLNDKLLEGPDLSSNLVGVPTRKVCFYGRHWKSVLSSKSKEGRSKFSQVSMVARRRFTEVDRRVLHDSAFFRCSIIPCMR